MDRAKMLSFSSLKQLKIIFPLTLLLIILMRLVSIQVRTFHSEYSSRFLLSAEYLSERFPLTNQPTADGQKCSLSKVSKTNSDSMISLVDWQKTGERSKALDQVRARFSSLGLYLFFLSGCEYGKFNPPDILKLNIWVFLGVVFFNTLLVRFLSGSWIMAMIGAIMILSRGTMTANLGVISQDFWMTLAFTVWMTCMVHFFKTGSFLSFIGSYLGCIFGGVFDSTFVILGLATPLSILLIKPLTPLLLPPFIREIRSEHKLEHHQLDPPLPLSFRFFNKGISRIFNLLYLLLNIDFRSERSNIPPSRWKYAVFQTLRFPFLVWIYTKKRWYNFLIFGLGLFLMSVILFAVGHMVINQGWNGFNWPRLFSSENFFSLFSKNHWFWQGWYQNIGIYLDFHLLLSLGLLFFSIFFLPYFGLKAYLETVWFWLAGTMLVGVHGFLADYLDFLAIKGASPTAIGLDTGITLMYRNFLLWSEPTLLCLGIVAIQQILTVIYAKLKAEGN